MCEILAPAGGKESALAAINSGADAIYLGLSEFSARSSAENFDLESLGEIISLAKFFGVKVYVAMNTLIKDGELDAFFENLISAWNCGADAIIISDIFLGRYVKRVYPQIKLHLSTQAGVCNVFGAILAKEYGFDRVILSRETKSEDIKEITKIIETEVFIHGALCTCFSGQCYLSSFAGGNSGNRGRCKQPCRKLYSIDREGFEELSYKISLSDLSLSEDIKKLIDCGVFSFKIEGRMRRPEYVAAAVKYYKNILSGKVGLDDLSDLKRTYNRGNYTKGLAFGQDKSLISSSVQGHIGEFAGVIKVVNGKFLVLSSLKFQKGDGFKILRGGKEIGGGDFAENCRDGFYITSKSRLLSGDKVFITTDTAVNERVLSKKRLKPIKISAYFCVGNRAKITIDGVDFVDDEILQSALNSPLTENDIKECFKKTDKYPFEISFGEVITDGVFVPKSRLNFIRREAYKRYFAFKTDNKNEKIIDFKHEFKSGETPLSTAKNEKIAVISSEFAQFNADILIFKPSDYSRLGEINFNDFKGSKYLYLPPYISGKELNEIEPYIKNFDGIYSDGVWAIEYARRVNKPLFAGCGMNISNKISLNEIAAEYIALSKELTEREQGALAKDNVFALTCGDIKVMDLIYCPFGKSCAVCDKREVYHLTDENGRSFPMRRYKCRECRFELYNCASLVGSSVTGTLIDCSLGGDVNCAVKAAFDIEKQKKLFKNYTKGHSNSPIL